MIFGQSLLIDIYGFHRFCLQFSDPIYQHVHDLTSTAHSNPNYFNTPS